MSDISSGGTAPLKPLKWYKKLATKKGRLEAGAFLVEGHRNLDQIFRSHPDEIIEILTVEELPAVYRNYPIRFIADSQLRSICFTRTPQGPAAVVRLPIEIYSDRLPASIGTKVLLLEDVQDPGNIGTLIRTAAAFDFSGVILTTKCADPLAPKSIQATAGTVLSIWLRVTDQYLGFVDDLRRRGFYLVAADLNGAEDMSLLHQDKLLLALGNEASGLSGPILSASDYRLRVPIVLEKAESLNVAACGAICMYVSSERY